jgi:ribosome-associated protein
MATRTLTAELLQKELIYSASRSSGPGGQHVNKTNSKITVDFNIAESATLSEDEKATLLTKLASRLTSSGNIQVSSQEGRSQLQNKEDATLKLIDILTKALQKKKIRRPTKPSKGSVKNRIKKKKQHSEKKQWRQKLQ